MYPDLLEIFGITLHGTTFEQFLWIISSLVMLWGIASSFVIYKKGRKGEALTQGVIVVALLLWFIKNLVASFSPDYKLVFDTPIVIHTYAFCILIGITCGVFSAMWLSPHRGIDKSWIAKLCLWFVLIGFVGARLAHVIVDYETYWNSCFDPASVGLSQPNCMRVFNVSEGGLTFYGGVLSGFIVLTVACIMRKRANPKFKIFHLVDLLAIALAVAHAFGRIGCLAAGCCWGAITSSGWGIHYGPGTFAYLELAKDPHWHPIITAAGQTPGMHPSQLYEAFGEFIIFGIMCLIAYRQHKRQEVQIQHEVDAGFVPAPGSSVTINEAGQRTLEPNAALSSALSGLSALDKNANTEKPENKVETVKSQASAENNPASAEKQAAKAENKTEKSEPTVLPENKANHVENKAESPENKANAADIKAEEEAKKLKERLALFEKYLPDHPGRITAIWFIGYGVLRFFVEMMRDDTERGYYFQQVFPSLNELLNVDPNHVTILTTSQGIALGMIIFGVIALVSSTKKHA